MPYIKQEDKERFKILEEIYPDTPGELNYCLTKLCLNYLSNRKETNYGILNAIIGVLECCKQEFYRRKISEYENLKITENGDVY